MSENGEITPMQAFNALLDGYDNTTLNNLFFQRYQQRFDELVGPDYDSDEEDYFRKEGFYFLKIINVNGIEKVCCLQRMAFTVGLMVGVTMDYTYEYRYCFKTLKDAFDSLTSWTGRDHPPGNWIKRKGEGGDLSNPNLEREP